jgi:Protein of unknown function (DUF3592)
MAPRPGNYPTPPTFRPRHLGFWLRSLVPAVAVAGVVAFVFLRPPVRLSIEGRPTRATVAEDPCTQGTVVHYRYQVGIAAYTGKASAHSLGASCATLSTGASVPVLYLPSDPATSMGAIGVGQARREAALATGVVFLIVFLGIAVLLRTYSGPSVGRGANGFGGMK